MEQLQRLDYHIDALVEHADGVRRRRAVQKVTVRQMPFLHQPQESLKH
jgi:ribosome-binding factor A